MNPSNELTYYRAEIDGKLIGFHNKTKFLVQLSKGRSSYKTKHQFTGNVYKALAKYEGMGLIDGTKKRLVMVGSNRPVLKKDKK